MKVLTDEKYIQTTMASKIKKGFFHELVTNKTLFLMALPGLLFLFINNYLPMLGIVVAFKRIRYGNNIFETYFGSPWNGLKNFEFFIKTPDAFTITRNTVLYNVAFILIGLVLAVTVAITINELWGSRLAKLYQSTMVLPNFFSMVVVAMLAYAFLSIDQGFLNKVILPRLGMQEIHWYQQPKYWPFILTGIQLWVNLGVGSVIYLSSITGISEEYYEAAVIDGATKWQQITSITIPLLKPTMTIMTLISLGGIFSANFGLFYNVPMESGALFSVTNVIDTYVYRALRSTGQVEMAAAASFYQSVVGFIIVMLSNAAVKKANPDYALF